MQKKLSRCGAVTFSTYFILKYKNFQSSCIYHTFAKFLMNLYINYEHDYLTCR